MLLHKAMAHSLREWSGMSNNKIILRGCILSIIFMIVVFLLLSCELSLLTGSVQIVTWIFTMMIAIVVLYFTLPKSEVDNIPGESKENHARRRAGANLWHTFLIVGPLVVCSIFAPRWIGSGSWNIITGSFNFFADDKVGRFLSAITALITVVAGIAVGVRWFLKNENSMSNRYSEVDRNDSARTGARHDAE